MLVMKLYDNIERWLIHENYSFKKTQSEDCIFKIVIKHVGAFGNAVEIFEPQKQQNTIVIGSKVSLKNNHNARFLKFTEEEKQNFEKNVSDFCYSIQAVHRFFEEDGKKIVGVYIVLDKIDQLNQTTFHSTLQRITEMSDKTTQFLLKIF